MTALADRDALPSYAGPFRTALLIMACLAATIVGWGMYARLDAAVVTHGVMLAESQRKTVEHFEGGILRILYVKAGDRVHEGQVVAQLDATQVEAAIARLGVDRDALAHQIWRLAAEEAGTPALDPATAPEPGGPQALAAARLFAARAEAQASQLAALDRQRDELTAQVAANEGVAAATERQLASWHAERATAESLVAKGATPRQKLLEFDRNVAALEGQRDEARSLAAAAREGIARTASERRTLEQKRLVEIGEQLVEARRALAGVAAELRAAGDVLERSRLRAPQDGLVVHVGIVTPGAVVASGAPVMEIIPDGDRLVVETRLPPDAIDTVHVGRLAKVRLTAFKRAVAPSVDGEVIYVSADLLEDERDGEPYFDARVALDPDSVAALGDAELTAGMPVEVAIQTGERRAGEYFLEPLLRHMRRALRDE